MIKRTLEISKEAAHLSVCNRQLVLKKGGATLGQVPCEDIGVVMVDHPGATYTHAALTELASSNAVVVLCGSDHLPSAIMLPIGGHTQIVQRLRDQLAVGKPLRKQLWKQLIQAKVRAQASNLALGSPARLKLFDLAKTIKSGDPCNVEAHAARIYWDNWLDDPDFRRDRDAPGINAFLNYGYAVMRAAIGRAIVAAGLSPTIGIHHHNRGNAFCLADDLIEPLRPLVDRRVRDLSFQGHEELTQEAKAELLELLTVNVRMPLSKTTGPLMVSLHGMVASLAQCYGGEVKKMEIPQPC